MEYFHRKFKSWVSQSIHFASCYVLRLSNSYINIKTSSFRKLIYFTLSIHISRYQLNTWKFFNGITMKANFKSWLHLPVFLCKAINMCFLKNIFELSFIYFSKLDKYIYETNKFQIAFPNSILKQNYYFLLIIWFNFILFYHLIDRRIAKGWNLFSYT